MSADPEKTRDAFADQLASFDDRLQDTANDVDMLTDIQNGIGALLSSSGGSEAEIRRVLQERYEQGGLRKETFQLVKSMLDRYGSDKDAKMPPAATSTAPVIPVDEQDDEFGSTTVIPPELVPAGQDDYRVQVGSILRDRFLLQEQVSGGSMGVVYKALDRRLAEAGSEDSYVAIKVLSPQLAEDGRALRALQQEAAKGRCLVHPHIVRFIDLDRDDDLYFLVMEWLEGRTLASILDSSDARSIDVDAAFRIVRQVGDALNYAHRCGIVHADVKPGNIMILPNGDAKLFDFGVARVQQQQSERDFDPGILGALTPAYSSMQVLTGEKPVASDDVFSLACLLYRLVAGYRVFGPRNAAEASQAGMTPQRPQGLSDSQWRTLKKALSYARVTRFDSVREFLDALEDTGEDTISLEAPVARFEEDSGGSPGKWIAVVVVVLGALGIGAKQFGLLDPYLEAIGISDAIVELPAAEQPGITGDQDGPGALPGGDEVLEEIVVSIEPKVMPEPAPKGPPLVDFSKLPPPTIEVSIRRGVKLHDPARVVLREDGDPAIVDFVREGELDLPLSLRLEEIGFSGNRSPWGSGQFALSNAGLVYFPVGQERGRLTLHMASDPRREADQTSTLRLREADLVDSEMATLVVVLEDDDQRAFEQRLRANTIAFATGQVVVSESDPAVQIDVIRLNPDDSSVVRRYTVSDVTATEGEDYFAPGSYSALFGPGQRSARLLIPLVQDAEVEGDETFVVELEPQPDAEFTGNVIERVVVVIRDDEPQRP